MWDDAAKDDIKKISRSIAIAINQKVLNFLAQDSKGNNSKPLKGQYKGIWRYRVFDDYKVFYSIDESEKIITITNLYHRSKWSQKIGSTICLLLSTQFLHCRII